MKICLVRHGQTIYNKLGKIQGLSNIPLSDEGRNQCRKLKDKMEDNHYDICFCSPLIRTMETAMILIGDKVEIRVDDRLIERDFGKLEGQPVEKYDKTKYWDYNLNSNELDVETVQDMFNRCNEFINYLKENYNDKNVLIVSHSAVLRVIYHILHKSNLDGNSIYFKIENCYYDEFEI